MIPASTPHCWPTSRRCAALFNSYYVSAGPRHPRLRRGDLSRPTLAEVMDYRRQVNRSTAALLQAAPGREDGELHARLTLGIAHEQQHQELIVTDMKHHIACQPLSPLHSPAAELAAGTAAPMRFLELPGGLAEIGHRGEGFAFDNKLPRHRIWFEPFALADRLVTETEYLAFMADGGHATPLLWLSDGWTTCEAQAWQAPLHWRDDGDGWRVPTWHGWRRPRADVAVCHVSHSPAFGWRATARLLRPATVGVARPRTKPRGSSSFRQVASFVVPQGQAHSGARACRTGEGNARQCDPRSPTP